MLLPLPRATASVELVGSRSISSVAAAAEHHAAVLEKGRSCRAPLPQSSTGSGWGGGEEMWRRAGEVSALAGDVEEGEEMWPVRSGGAAHRKRDRERVILGLGRLGLVVLSQRKLTGRLSKLGRTKKIQTGPNYSADRPIYRALARRPKFGRKSFFSAENQNAAMDEEVRSITGTNTYRSSPRSPPATAPLA